MNHIGLDFDDTLVDMRRSIVELLNELTGKNLISENVAEYAFSDLYGYTYQEFFNIFSINQERLHLIEPYTQLKETLEELGRDSKISVMTSRPLEWMDSAVKWINEKDLRINDVICASEYKNGKAECAALRNVTLFIEDNPEHAVSIAEAGIDVLLLDKPYNRNCHHPRIKRVNSWTEIRKVLLS
ncbi:Uncharacterized protein, HAD superfamily [Paenibacillus sp. yr247]|uniref:5' nucleotidase, NT5C type n=1 Tax=Paenibacillus sp. yr247 TaxID=1761880 RepID=UPI00087E048A|nr:HAD hydrolase-like protein [Paenibacillus sp. yr247]SDP04304.1 Uncharacterized protein, HAD superfamily [Paenibacillus sp. yr247]